MWETKRAPVWTIVAAVAAQFLLAPFFQFIVFPRHWFTPVSHATSGLINSTLLANAIALIVVVGGVILLGGRLRPKDVGLAGGSLAAGVWFTLALWLTVNALLIIVELSQSTSFAFNEMWRKPGALRVIGDLISQIFGTALDEEIVFRGFLTVQVILLLRPLGKSAAFILGIVAVQLLFASVHVPLLLEKGQHWAEIWSGLPLLFVFGTGSALLYFLTGNLFVAVGTHALINAVVLVPADPLPSSHALDFLYLGLALVAAIAWWITAQLRHKDRPQPSVV